MKDASPNPKRTTLGQLSETALPCLEETTAIRVRFSEVDALGFVWHGHYANYFEEARRAFGRQYGIDYATFMDHAVAVPVVQLHIDFFAPVRMSDLLTVTARLRKSESAKLTFAYELRRQAEPALLAAGSTVQVFTTFSGELLLTWPPFMLERLKAWEPLWH
jgi:acyl-CoA thioester hydrolase